MKSDISNSPLEPRDDVRMTPETDGAPIIQIVKQTPRPRKISWPGIIVSIFIIGAIAHFAGCDENSQTSVGEKNTLSITKADWRRKALPFYNPGGGIKLTTVANFKAVMGEPSSTQTTEGHAYWYYDCADGVIQVVLIDPALSGGTLAIDSINDY